MPRRSLRASAVAEAAAKSPETTPVADKTARPHRTPQNSRGAKTNPSVKNKRKASSDELSETQSPSPSIDDAETSGYEDDEIDESEPSSEDESNAYSDSDDGRSKKRQKTSANVTPKSTKSKGSKFGVTSSAGIKGKELWRPGVKAGLGPGTQVVIDKPKARPAGKTPYKDETIHPNTMLFLSELAQNNDRQWLKMHDPDYRTSWKDFTSFLESLQEKLLGIDETIPELPTKDIVFRIYRDIRFSNDPTPYKTHFSAAWSRTGRKGPYAVYYFQLKPGGGSALVGGLWQPEAQFVRRIRRDIDRRPHRIKEALKSPSIRKEFFGGVAAEDKKVVKAFTEKNSDNALKTKPMGYDADHRDIELLRLKNFTIGRRLADAEVLGPKGIDRIAELMRSLVPFVTYLNNVVMPDGDDDLASDVD